MYNIILLIAPFFGVILVGYLFAKLRIAHIDWTDTLNIYVVRIGFPSVIFYSLAKAPIQFSEHYRLFFINSVYIILCFLLALIIGRLFRLSPSMKRTMFICLPYGNVAYLGLPVLTEVFGQQIIPLASLIISIYLIWTFSVGIFYLEKSANSSVNYKTLALGLIKNPLLIGVFCGILASFFKLSPDGVFLKIFDIIGKSTTPVIMLSLGIFISQVKFGKWQDWINISAYTFLKIMVLPALFVLLLHVLKMDIHVNLPSVVEAAMPFALTPYALAGMYGLERDFIAKSILLSTTLSILSLPFWLVVLR
jgi:predicted permease